MGTLFPAVALVLALALAALTPQLPDGLPDAATRLGWVTTRRPSTTPATTGGARVVFPVPGGASTTATLRSPTARRRP